MNRSEVSCGHLTHGFDREICEARERASDDWGIGIPLGLVGLILFFGVMFTIVWLGGRLFIGMAS